MPYRAITFTKQGHIATITLNRPEAGNAIDQAMAQEISDACRLITQDDDVYVVVLTGAGKSFCTGSKLSANERQNNPAAALAGVDRPVIAAINGDATGEGLEMALAADIRLASTEARFSMPQLAGGLIPMEGGTQRLPRIVGKAKALEMMLSAATINAREALEIGLVNQVLSPPELPNAVLSLAGTMATRGPIALRYIKEAVTKGLDLALEPGLRLEADLYFLLHTTADRTEGIRAFLEKRPPQFKNK